MVKKKKVEQEKLSTETKKEEKLPSPKELFQRLDVLEEGIGKLAKLALTIRDYYHQQESEINKFLTEDKQKIQERLATYKKSLDEIENVINVCRSMQPELIPKMDSYKNEVKEIYGILETAEERFNRLKGNVSEDAKKAYRANLASLGDVDMPYDVDYTIPYEAYQSYADKLLELVEKKSVEELEKIVKLGEATGARPMSYVLPDIALKIKRGQVFRSKEKLAEMDEDAYTYESYWVLQHCLGSATQEAYKKLMEHIA